MSGRRCARRTRPWSMVLFTIALTTFAGCASSNAFPNDRLPGASTVEVTLAADHTSYTTRTPIGVLLANASGASYYGLDGRSGCTLIQLQRYDSGSSRWNSVDGCMPAQAPRVLQIPAGVREPFTLPPGSSSDPNAWQTGIYRVAAAFSSNADGVTGERIAYSAGFRIG